jgi:hypothetical protein
VITGNYTTGSGAGLFLGNIPEVPNPGQVIMSGTIVANNTAGAGINDIDANNRMITSEGRNRVESHGPTFIPFDDGIEDEDPETLDLDDHVGPVDYVVTGVADTYDGTTDNVVMSLRDAIHQANITAGAQEIWLPAWEFMLTRDEPTYDNNGTDPTDMSVSFGDLDVGQDINIANPGGSLTIRGVNGLTNVAWRLGEPADEVFQLLGDYDNDGVSAPPSEVNTGDYLVWSKGLWLTSTMTRTITTCGSQTTELRCC